MIFSEFFLASCVCVCELGRGGVRAFFGRAWRPPSRGLQGWALSVRVARRRSRRTTHTHLSLVSGVSGFWVWVLRAFGYQVRRSTQGVAPRAVRDKLLPTWWLPQTHLRALARRSSRLLQAAEKRGALRARRRGGRGWRRASRRAHP